jgi:hypothetical protein
MQISNLEAIKALGHSGTTLKLECTKKIVELIILLISIPLGVLAVAWGIVIYNLISLLINTYPNRRYLDYGIFEQLKDVYPQLLISCSMGIILCIVNQLIFSNLLIMVVDILLGIAIYLALNIIFKTEAYRYLYNNLIGRIKRKGI